MKEANKDITIDDEVEFELNSAVLCCIQAWRIRIGKSSFWVDTGIIDENILKFYRTKWTNIWFLFV